MSHPDFIPLHTGDVRDDDAQILDRFLNDSTEPPDPLIVPITQVPLTEPVRCTRLLTGNVSVLTTFDPYLLLPADANRKNFYARVQAIDAAPSALTDWVLITDEPSKPGGLVRHGQDINMIGHTGPIWVAPSGSRVTTNISFWAVTL